MVRPRTLVSEGQGHRACAKPRHPSSRNAKIGRKPRKSSPKFHQFRPPERRVFGANSSRLPNSSALNVVLDGRRGEKIRHVSECEASTTLHRGDFGPGPLIFRCPVGLIAQERANWRQRYTPITPARYCRPQTLGNRRVAHNIRLRHRLGFSYTGHLG